MNDLGRFSLVLAFTGAVTLLVAPPTLDSLCELRSELWQVPQHLQRIHDLQEQAEELDQLHETLLRLRAMRSEVLTDLAEQRLTLPEAAALLADLDRQRPGPVPTAVAQELGRYGQECAYRTVIEHVRLLLQTRSPAQARAVVARLEAELQHFITGQETAPMR